MGGAAAVRERSSELKAVICVVGIYVCYLAYGVVQEGLMRYKSPSDGSQFRFTLSLLFVQCLFNAVAAFLMMLTYRQPKASPSLFTITGVSYIGAMLCSNEALKHVNFTTQTLGKSCKMVPTMLGGVVAGRKYRTSEYVAVAAITAGIVVFSLGKSSPSSQHGGPSHIAANESGGGYPVSLLGFDFIIGFGAYGVALLLVSLLLDGVTSAQQDSIKLAKGGLSSRPSPHQSMAFTNSWALVLLTVALAVTGEPVHFVRFVATNPDILPHIFAFALTSAIGQNFIFFTIDCFSPLVCSLITTTRKFFTFLASVAVYDHHLSLMQWGGVALVFSGLILELLGKYSRDSTLHGTGAPSAPSRLSTADARTSSHGSTVYAHDSENRGAGRPDEMAQADPAIATLGSAGGAGDYFLASGMGQLRKRASTRKEF